MSSPPRSSKCSNRKRRRHQLTVASSSLSSPAEEDTIKGELLDHYEVLDVESIATSAYIKRACRPLARKDDCSEDRISGLPDDILVNIISRVTLAEAASTSVLSTRWKYLWTFITVLKFDELYFLMNVNQGTLEDERTRYVNWVNKVLQSHRGLHINEFKVRFQLDASHESDITNWIYTAVLKGVQKLELNFFSVFWPSSSDNIYTFPRKCYDLLKTPPYLSRLNSLRSLYFDKVNVTREILEFFVYNCPYLEKLRVAGNDSLLRLKVVGSLLRMKYLHIRSCCNLEELEISCPSLLSFRYFGPIIKYCIKNVPCLVDASIRGYLRGYRIDERRFMDPIETYFPQLETLQLNVELNEESIQFPKCELPALRHLTVVVEARDCSTLLDLTCWMKLCPFLQKFTLKLNARRYSTEVRSRHQFPNCSHQHLKVVELFEFSGNPVELELAHYLLENTTMLEKLRIRMEFQSDDVAGEQAKKLAREQAQKLGEVVPQRVELVLLEWF